MFVPSNPPGSPPVVPPALAAVRAPDETVHYVPYAHDYHGFLVQHRYRGTGTSQQRRDRSVVGRVSRLWDAYDWFVPWNRPVLNPAAVAAAGFTLADVTAWAQVYGDAIFDHPTLAPYCLRWGANAHGYVVEPMPPWKTSAWPSRLRLQRAPARP